jgi:hypothetical protein
MAGLDKSADSGLLDALMQRELQGLNSWDVSDLNFTDPRILKAAHLLPQNERPNVQVQVEDPGYVFGLSDIRSRKDNSRLPIRLRKEAVAATPETRDRIVINRQDDRYKADPRLLASTLAHEQTHVKGEGEAVAYRKQLEVLRRMGVTDKRLLDHVERQIMMNELQRAK